MLALLNQLAVSFDLPILDWIQAHLQCGFLDAVMPIVTLFGEGGIFWIAWAVLMLVFPKTRKTGIAMGIAGTEVSKEASDIVLLDDSFATIVKAVEWGRNIYENFKRFISFQLTVNIASVICVFVSVLMGLPAPFTALQLLWINIIMDLSLIHISEPTRPY